MLKSKQSSESCVRPYRDFMEIAYGMLFFTAPGQGTIVDYLRTVP